ncbi:MAG: DedA family protein [Gemmatimonadota bacterium]
MDLLREFIDFALHLDDHLAALANQYGTWTYAILTAIIFAETGLVFTPFLPGDSLLFAAGALAAVSSLDIWVMCGLLTAAAIIGDTVNYWVGSKIGHLAAAGRVPMVKREHLERTHAFFEKHGGKTIIIARFVPIVRTFAPFVAGAGAMTYRKFLIYNVVGGVGWVFSMLFAGYFFGNLPFVRENFETVILAIIFLSILPGVIAWWRERRVATPVERLR